VLDPCVRDGIGHHGEKPPHLVGVIAAGHRLGGPWSFDGVAGLETTRPIRIKKRSNEERQATRAPTVVAEACGRTSRCVDEGEHVGWLDPIRREAALAKRPEHPGVGLDGRLEPERLPFSTRKA